MPDLASAVARRARLYLYGSPPVLRNVHQWIGTGDDGPAGLAPYVSCGQVLIRITALRFRVVVWGAMAVLLLTGTPLLHQRGIPIADPAGWPMVLSVKLGLVAVLLLFTVMHDLTIGPRVWRILQIPTESLTSFRSRHGRMVSLDRSLLASSYAGRLASRDRAGAELAGC